MAALAKLGELLSASLKAQSHGQSQQGGVEQFIYENSIDESASKVLMEQSYEVQQMVMARGSVADCANPSSVVMGRIRDAKRNAGGQAGGRSSPYGGGGASEWGGG